MPVLQAPPIHSKFNVKDGAQLLAAVPVCRSCLMFEGLKDRLHKEYAEDVMCSRVGCENNAAYLALMTPFEFQQ